MNIFLQIPIFLLTILSIVFLQMRYNSKSREIEEPVLHGLGGGVLAVISVCYGITVLLMLFALYRSFFELISVLRYGNFVSTAGLMAMVSVFFIGVSLLIAWDFFHKKAYIQKIMIIQHIIGFVSVSIAFIFFLITGESVSQNLFPIGAAFILTLLFLTLLLYFIKSKRVRNTFVR